MKINSSYPLALLVATGFLFATAGTLRAADTDDRIEAAAKKSHVFKTYLKDDAIKTESKNGVVTLTGTVTKVKTTLLFHRNVRATKTDVNVRDGVVILSGEASSQAQKELTTEYAKDVEGVKEVKNEMTIASAPAKSEETMGEKIDDASITAQVKSSLLAHRSTSAIKTKVQTTDGVVTVSGIAKNEAEKGLVAKLATDINGVTSVINNMTIAPVAKN
jgi:hyperosmotically inducible protein